MKNDREVTITEKRISMVSGDIVVTYIFISVQS